VSVGYTIDCMSTLRSNRHDVPFVFTTQILYVAVGILTGYSPKVLVGTKFRGAGTRCLLEEALGLVTHPMEADFDI
jgi:hypothetical protein